MEIKTITIIGQGNVASHYYEQMKSANLNVKTVSSRLPFKCEDLNVDLVIIAVKDEAIKDICLTLKEPFQKINDKNKNTGLHIPVLVHTSGFMDTVCLNEISENYGSFYPLQTLKKGIAVDFSSVPLCTWANNEETATALENLAKKLSNIHYNLDDNQRKTLHLAAVFVNNFPNHLFAIAKSILDKNNIPFNILFQLMDRTVGAVKTDDPLSVQTGPAFRNEKAIMEQHLQLLEGNEKEIYKIISEDIIRKHS